MNMVVNKLTLNLEKISEIAERMICNSNCSSTDIINESFTMGNTDSQIPEIDDEIMDYVKALMEFENDTELLNTLMGDFLKNTTEQLSLMKNSFENHDFGTIQRESHGIKGGAASLCAMPLSAAAKALEMACKKHESPDTISNLLDELDQAVDLFGRYVNRKLSFL
jgi:HPt (histidine-containing phosphotransfer) domain-containing protein